MPQYLRSPQAATFLRENFGFGASRTLAKLRVRGGGPAFRKIGRLVVYEPNDLIAWAKNKLGPRQHSTSETQPPGSKEGIESDALRPLRGSTSEAPPKRAAELADGGISAK